MTDSSPLPSDWRHWASTPPVILGPLPGGLTNRSYLLRCGEELVVLRQNSPRSEALNLNRVAEEQALRQADQAGLTAPLVYCDPEHRYLVTKHINCQQEFSQREHNITELATLIRRIHQLPGIESHLDIHAKVTHYWSSIDPTVSFITELKSLSKAMSIHLQIAPTQPKPQCLCHNDLLQSNLLFRTDGQLIAIDWEYAAMGDPFYDLALVVEGHRLQKDQQHLLLREYLQAEPSQSNWERLLHWQVIYSYLTVLWYAVQLSSGALDETQVEDSMPTQIERVLSLLNLCKKV